MRYTKIVATVGPSTSSPQHIQLLMKHGVDVARLNFSHGNHDSHKGVIASIRALNEKADRPMALMLDTKGPEIRTGDVDAPIEIRKGEKILFAFKPPEKESMKVVRVDYPMFAHDVKDAHAILIDNGELEFKVVSIQGKNVVAKALESGRIGSRRHINIPGAYVSLPSFTEKDWSDILFGIHNDVDFIATSFVRTAKDIRSLRTFLRTHKSHAEIIAKIETQQAVDNIESIVHEADGIMVARGDLGAEVPYEQLPRIQDMIVRLCRSANKPVIVATHMLESMIDYPMPTRAEITDIAHACVSQTDATMLSGETASGLFPFKAIDAMARILAANEKVDTLDSVIDLQKGSTHKHSDPRLDQGLAAGILARNLQADALVIFTRHGITARAVSHWRPLVPMIAFTESAHVQRQLRLCWGVDPYAVPFRSDPEKTVKEALDFAKKRSLVRKGQRIVVVSDILTGSKSVMTIQIRTID